MKRLVLALALCAPLLAAAETSGDLFVKGDAAAGEKLAGTCAACHGPAGVSGNPEWPSLAQQNARYTFEQLKAFKEGTRKNPLMSAQAAGLTEQNMRDLAAYFAEQTAKPGVASEESVAIAEPLYRAGDLERGILGCAGCHAPNGVGNPAAGYPKVAGQHATYTAKRLRAYRSGDGIETAHGKIMAAVAEKLTDEEIDALASYLNGLQIR